MESGKIIKKFKSLKGHEVIIRSLSQKDLDDLLAFANGLIEEDTFVMLSGNKLTRQEEEKYLNDALEKIKKNQKIQLVVLVNGELAGSGDVRRFDKRKSHVGEIGISLGRKFRNEGIGTELLKTLIEEAKNLGLKLVYLHCFETNARALHVYQKLGFKSAGMVPGMLSYKNKYIGEVTMYLSLTKQNIQISKSTNTTNE